MRLFAGYAGWASLIDRVEPPEHARLGLEVLDHRLDGVVGRSRRALEVGRRLDASARLLRLLGRHALALDVAIEVALDASDAARDRCVVHLDDRDLQAGLGDHLRDAAAHQPTTADDDDAFDCHPLASGAQYDRGRPRPAVAMWLRASSRATGIVCSSRM